MSLTYEERVSRVDGALTRYRDFPKPGITFVDIFPIMRSPEILEDLISLMVEHIKEKHSQVEVIVGLDARGFIFGPLIAQRLVIGFAPVRKAGKLPGETVQASYTLEYGSATFEVQKSSLKAGQKVIIVDDLLATGGTMSAACRLLEQLEVCILECMVVIELTQLAGHKQVPTEVFSVIKETD